MYIKVLKDLIELKEETDKNCYFKTGTLAKVVDIEAIGYDLSDLDYRGKILIRLENIDGPLYLQWITEYDFRLYHKLGYIEIIGEIK